MEFYRVKNRRLKRNGKWIEIGERIKLGNNSETERLLKLGVIEKITEEESTKLNLVNIDTEDSKPVTNTDESEQDNPNDDSEEVEYTEEQIMAMTEEELDKIAEDNGFDLKCRKQDTKAAELWELLSTGE